MSAKSFPLHQFALLPIAREQEEELRLKSRVRLAVVERLQERVLFPLLQHLGGVEAFGQSFHQGGFSDADNTLNGDIAELHAVFVAF